METKQKFLNAVKTGREIEFTYLNQHYFESRRSDTDWYIYHEETMQEQHFSSAEEMLENTILQGQNINDIWMQITIDFIL